jgi:hypothetical protein
MNNSKRLQVASKLARTLDKNKIIGFYGQPDLDILQVFIKSGYQLLDLDIGSASIKDAPAPKTCCQIIQNILSNAWHYQQQLGVVLCCVGKDKCSEGAVVQEIIKSWGIPTLDATNHQRKPLRPLLLSKAKALLVQRVERIMRLCYQPLTDEEEKQYRKNQMESGEIGFWGVPPNDVTLLEIFPETTEIFGWIRLVEQGIPCRLDLEPNINPSVPTVFYCQTFCHKQLLAHQLAERYGGLVVDGQESITGSMRAKLEAFIHFKQRRS